MSCAAFATGPFTLARGPFALDSSSFISAKPAFSTKRTARAAVCMDVETPPPGKALKDTLADPTNVDAPEKLGFTLFSEQFNGRAAMIGFVAAVGAEVLNPLHPTVAQQLISLVTFFPNVLFNFKG